MCSFPQTVYIGQLEVRVGKTNSSLIPFFHSLALECSLLEGAMVLSVLGTWRPGQGCAFGTSYCTQKILLSCEFVTKDEESILAKVPKCDFGDLER